MYHLANDGPRVCHAKVRSCPYEISEHYDTASAAEEAFASNFNLSSTRKLFAPEKLATVSLTTEEARSILEELRGSHPGSPVLSGELLAHSNFGSIVYNLDSPESDNDLFFIVDKKAKNDFQNIDSSKRDIRVSSVFNFSQEYLNGTHFSVDINHSGALRFSQDEGWPHFLSNLRFNRYEYVTKLRGLSLLYAGSAEATRNESKKVEKLIKTALRNEILANRFQREDRVRPVFTDVEREGFYRGLSFISKRREGHPSIHELVQKYASEVT